MNAIPTPLGLLWFSSSCKWTLPISRQLCLVPRVSAFGRFDCTCIVFHIYSPLKPWLRYYCPAYLIAVRKGGGGGVGVCFVNGNRISMAHFHMNMFKCTLVLMMTVEIIMHIEPSKTGSAKIYC